MTLPAWSRVAEISCETKRTVICAVLPRNSAPTISACVERNEMVLDGLALGVAHADRRLEAVIDLPRQQTLQCRAVAGGEGATIIS